MNAGKRSVSSQEIMVIKKTKNNGRSVMMQPLQNNTNPSELLCGWERINCRKSPPPRCSSLMSEGLLPPHRGSKRFADHLPAMAGITYDYILQASITDAALWLSILKTLWCGNIVPSFRCEGNVWHQLCYYKLTRSHFRGWQRLAGDAQANVDDPSAELIK